MRWLTVLVLLTVACDKEDIDTDTTGSTEADTDTEVDTDTNSDTDTDTAVVIPDACPDNASIGDLGCDGVCDEGEANSVDCDGVCAEGDAAPDCDDRCDTGEEDSADCDAICDDGDVAPDCDGVCSPSDSGTSDCDAMCSDGEDGSEDCDGICDTNEDGPDCDGLCETSESNAIDCDDVCDDGEEDTVDCEVVEEVSFPSGSSPCGLAFDERTETVYVIQCFGADILTFSADGTPGPTLARPAEPADDVDLDIAPADFLLGTYPVNAGALLFHNGESGVVETYVVDTTDSNILASLTTTFGASHVVGGSYDSVSGNLVYIQDKNVSAPNGNAIAQVNAQTGAFIDVSPTLPAFQINYGDVDVCQSTGNRFAVSSDETTVAEFTSAGVLVGEYAFPATVSGASGIDFDDSTGEAWIAAFTGQIWRVDGLPCPPLGIPTTTPGGR
jgi:hypothetical protein